MVDPQFWTIFIPLLCAHVAGDFLLQTDAAVKRKRDVSVLLKHVLILSVLSYLLVGILGAWQLVVVIFISHALIDTVKTRSNRNNLTVFLLDQCVHVLILILTAYLVVRWQLYPLEGVWLQWLGTAYLDGLILFTGAVSCIYVGGFVVAYRVAPSPEKLEGSEPRTGEREGGVEAPRITHAGRIIGYLERALIFILVMANQVGLIGFVLVAKSIYYAADLRERENRTDADSMIIGTLMSFVFGMLIAFSTKYLLDIV